MKKLLNTLYVLSPDSYLYCRNETICVKIGGEDKVAVPALSVESVVCFGKETVSTPLIGFCAERGISLVFLSEHGRFLARINGPVSGNVLLRKRQYESLQKKQFVSSLVRNILMAKLRNSKNVLLRSARTEETAGKGAFYESARRLSELAQELERSGDVDSMRGIEGAAATVYFACFDHMLGEACPFRFQARSRQPPVNEVNAALSFAYTLLCREMQSALATVGLDPAAGYLHTLRPGRPSLALDMMEELRGPLADRFVLTLFHRKQLGIEHFEQDGEAVFLNEKGRRVLLSAWQKRKGEIITHPFLNEKVQIGIIPYAQAMLLARVLRGDLDCYPPFIWR